MSGLSLPSLESLRCPPVGISNQSILTPNPESPHPKSPIEERVKEEQGECMEKLFNEM